MADELSMALLELLRKSDPDQRTDFLRTAVERLAQTIIEVEVEQKIGAGRYEGAETRNNSRNGARGREWDTTAGTAHLRIPKLRHGSLMPVLLEPRRRAHRALANVVAEAYVAGVSTRKVDDLVQAMGLEGMDKSTVSRLAGVLDEEVRAFRERPLTAAYPSPHHRAPSARRPEPPPATRNSTTAGTCSVRPVATAGMPSRALKPAPGPFGVCCQCGVATARMPSRALKPCGCGPRA